MALPIPLVAKLQVNVRQRIGLGLLFFVGSIATATSIVRLFSIQQGGKSTDVSWNTSYSTTWSAIEINVAIICACLPILRVPIQAVFPKLFGSKKKSSTLSTPGNIPSGQGAWSRISTSNSKRQSQLVPGSRRDPTALELESLPVDGRIRKNFGSDCSKNEEERCILGDEEQDIGGARHWLDAEMETGLVKEGIVKTTDINVDYRKT
ncbi:MAG: hypothetical protein Q9167_000937 [Letrouitia subvulpina]